MEGGDGGAGGFANWAGFTAGSNGMTFYIYHGLHEMEYIGGSELTGVDGDSGQPSHWDDGTYFGASGGGGGSSGPSGFVQVMSNGGNGGGGGGGNGNPGTDGIPGESQTALTGESVILAQSLQLGGRGGSGGSGGNGANGGGGGGGAGGGGAWPAGLQGQGGAAGAAGLPGNFGAQGNGTIQVASGGILNNESTIVIRPSSWVLVLNGGTFTNTNEGIIDNNGEMINQGLWTNNGLINGNLINDGTFTGSGHVAGTLTNNGTVSPGSESQAETMTIDDWNDNGNLVIQLASLDSSPSAYDVLQVNTQLTLTGSTLVLEFVNGLEEADLNSGDFFDIVRYPEMTDQIFSQVDGNLAPLIHGEWQLVYNQPIDGGYSIRLTYFQDPSGVDNNSFPDRFALKKVYPNPFNPRVTISYELPKASRVNFRIYDVAGHQVWSSAMNQVFSAGRHELQWTGVDQAGRTLPSGPYFLKMQAGKFQASRRVMLVR